MKKQETINLVVIPANVDIATTEALRMARKVDPDGQRTLGNVVFTHFIYSGGKYKYEFVLLCHT